MIVAVILATLVVFWAVWVAYEVTKNGIEPQKPEPLNVPEVLTSSACTQKCRQGRDCTCFQQSCDMTTKDYDNPNWPFPAPWPFPTDKKP